MLDLWREKVPSAHFRKLSGLPATGHSGSLPIETHTAKIMASIEANHIIGVRSPPGSGKTMRLPELLNMWATQNLQTPSAVMILFPTQFGCQEIRNSMVDFRQHDPWTVNLWTGVDKNDKFWVGFTKFQVVTYGMLWMWLVKSGPEISTRLYQENCAFLLDEFSGKAAGGDSLEVAADPQTMEIARLLARFVRDNPRTHRLLVTGAALDKHLMDAVLPGADFMAFTGRMYPLERCIIAPRKFNRDEILTLCTQLICITIENDEGNILVFLPGLDEIMRLGELVKQNLGRHGVNIVRLHSHLLGEGETSQEHADPSSDGRSRQLYLSSAIAARGVTLPDIKYVFIHPYNRTTYLHQSGLETLGDVRISAELNANKTGRAGRTAPGQVVYLFEFNDSEEALLSLEEERGAETVHVHLRAPPKVHVQQYVTLILGPPSRLPYIQATMRQLSDKHFPNILWLRMLDPSELDDLVGATMKPQQRLMALWRMTVLPAVLKVCETYNYAGAMVVEDTVLLRQDVTYSDVAAEIRQRRAPAGVWGYGHRLDKQDSKGKLYSGWHGIKGLFMTAEWCKEIAVMLENTNLEKYWHIDLWLANLLKRKQARGFVLYSVLAGYGHRVSMSTSQNSVQKFGGCWLPQSSTLNQAEADDYIFSHSPPGMREWVEACRVELGRTPSRGDVVTPTLVLELPEAGAYREIGLYKQTHSVGVPGQEAAACYELDMAVPVPSSVKTDFNRPPEPRTEARIGTNLDKLWEVHVARCDRDEKEFPELSCSEIQLGKWKYGAAMDAVTDSPEAKLPLSPEWQHFVQLCRANGLAAEGLHLAVFLSEGPWTFDVQQVAPTWIKSQVWWDGQQSSDQAHMQGSLLFIYSNILPDLESFLTAVNMQQQQKWGNHSLSETETKRQPELDVPRSRLWKAHALLDKCKRHEARRHLLKNKYEIINIKRINIENNAIQIL